MRSCPKPQRQSHQYPSLIIFLAIFQIIRYLLINAMSRSCLIKSWCTEENIYCRVSIPHTVFPSLGFRASSAQRCHRWTRHQHPDFERCQMPPGSLYIPEHSAFLETWPQMLRISDEHHICSIHENSSASPRSENVLCAGYSSQVLYQDTLLHHPIGDCYPCRCLTVEGKIWAAIPITWKNTE